MLAVSPAVCALFLSGPFVPALANPSYLSAASGVQPIELLGSLGGTGAVADGGDDAARFVAGLAERKLYAQVIKEARAFLNQYASHPQSCAVRYHLAEALFEQKDLAAARPEYERLVHSGGFELIREARFRAAQCALELKDAASALEHLQALLSSNPDYLELPGRFLLAEAAYALGRLEQAEAAFEAVVKRDAGGNYGLDAAYSLCFVARDRGAHADVLERIDHFEQRALGDPRLSELRLLRGETHLALGEAELALLAYRSVSTEAPNQAGLRGETSACIVLEQFGEAARVLDRLIGMEPALADRGDLILRAGSAYLSAGEAETAWQRLSAREVPASAEREYWRGKCLLALARPKEALEALDSGLKTPSDGAWNQRLQTARAEAFSALGRDQEAAAAFEAAGGDYALHAAAIAQANLGQHEEALRLAEALLDRYPQSSYAQKTLLAKAEALFQLKHFERADGEFGLALEALQKSGGSASERLMAASRRAWCRFSCADFAEAEKRFCAVAQSAPGERLAQEAGIMAARSAEQRGDIPRAIQLYLEFSTREPGSLELPQALLRLARLQPGLEGEAALQRLLGLQADGALLAQARLEWAERLSAREEFETALQQYRLLGEAQDQQTYAAPAQYGRAFCEYRLGQFDGALASLESLQRNPKAEPALRASATELLVWIETARVQPDRAERAAQALLQDQPDLDGARLFQAVHQVGRLLLENKAESRAAALYATLASALKDRPEALQARVEGLYCVLAKPDLDAAEEGIRVLCQQHPTDQGVCEAAFFVGEARFDQSRFEPAMQLYDLAAVGQGVVRERALYKSAYAGISSQQWAAAAERLARLIKDYPKSEFLGEALFLHGECQFQSGEFEAGAASLARVPKEFAAHEVLPKALFRLGQCQLRAKKPKEAAQSLALLVQRFPDFANLPEAELERGRALVASKDGRGARQAFASVLEREGGLLAARARLELAQLEHSENNLDAALSEYLKVSVLHSGTSEAVEASLRAGEVLEVQGELDAARERYREVLQSALPHPFGPAAKARIEALSSH